MAEAENTQAPKKLTRAGRKRLETRARIISATEELMQTRPLNELTIAEITEVADVGHGTFYGHFDSKYEVVVPIIQRHAAQWDEAAQAAAQGLEDPAEVVAHAARQIGRIIATDALYRWFFEHSGVPVEDMRDALGVFVARDVRRGISSGRFKLTGTQAGINFLFGGIVIGLIKTFDEQDPGDAIDDLAEMLLRGLGLPVAEAREIAHRPLDPLVLEIS